MTYEEFLNKVPAYVGLDKVGNMLVLKGHIYPEPNRRYSYGRKEKDNKKDYSTEALYFSCYKGGMSGGSCWNDENTKLYYNSSNEKISYEALDTLLEEVCPQISFLDYRKIQKLLSDVSTWTESEYYGNTSEYEYQVLPLRELYDLLVDLGYLE